MKIGIIIPAYNEEKSIEKTIRGVLHFSKNIIVIDDGSKDRTYEILKKFPIKVIRNQTNLGLSETVKIGLKYLLEKKYDYGIKLDADGQMEHSKLSVFIDNIKSNPSVDVFYATIDNASSWAIKKDIKIFSYLYFIGTGIKTRDFLSEYRAYNQNAMRFLINNKSNEGYASCFTLIDMQRLGFKTQEIHGGVYYTKETARPFPLEGKVQLTRYFITKMFKFNGLRSKVTACFLIFPLLGLIFFNLMFCSGFNSILPKRFVR